jgi:hypothetical protein
MKKTGERKSMKMKFFTIIILTIVLSFGFQIISAQFPINLPKLPKIKKEKPKAEQPSEQQTPPQQTNSTTDNNQSGSSSDNRAADKKTAAWLDGCSEKGWWITAHLDHIAQQQKEVEEYTPADRNSLISSPTNDNYLLYAVSPKAREEWLKNAKSLDLKDCPKLVTAFDKLAAAAAKQLPTYKADLLDYKVHNPAEEKLMRGVYRRIADFKIYSVGLAQSNWLIDKDDYGLPIARFKRGAVYLKDTTDDHPYCYLSYVNVIQDYAGGGTYGASYARFTRDELVGCPAGK